MNNTQLIKATDPQTQKVHIKHAKIEIEDGIKNLQDAILTSITTPNFLWEAKEKQEHREFLAKAKRKIDGLYSYFNLPK